MVAFNDFKSKTANENLKYIVYIPPCYLQTQKRYPYVILLHGLDQGLLFVVWLEAEPAAQFSPPHGRDRRPSDRPSARVRV